MYPITSKTAFYVNHVISFTMNSDKTLELTTDWFSLNKNGVSFTVNQENLLKSILYLSMNNKLSYTLDLASVAQPSINIFRHININNLKIVNKYFRKLMKVANNSKIVCLTPGLLPSSGILKTYIIPKFVGRELRFYVCGVDLIVANRVVMSYCPHGFKSFTSMPSNLAISLAFQDAMLGRTFDLYSKSYELPKPDQSKDYTYNKDLYTKLYKNIGRLHFADKNTYQCDKITDISFVTNPKTGYSFIIHCGNMTYTIKESDVALKILTR